MQIKSLILFGLALLLTNIGFAQPPVDWVTTSTVGGAFQDVVEDVFVDASGNTYACGSFRGSLTIGSNNLFGGSAGQAFVVKYNSAGTVEWAWQSTGTNQAVANSIHVDNTGNVYVAGFHSHPLITFSGIPLVSNSNQGFYILKINAGGSPIHMTGPTALTTGKSEAWGITGDNDYVYVTGAHRGPINLPGGPALGAPVGDKDVFYARVDSSLATFDYAFSNGGINEDLGRSIILNNNSIFITGDYHENPTFTAPGPDYDLPDYGSRSIFILEADKTNGDIAWVNTAGSAAGPSYGYDLVMNGPSLLVTGSFSDSTIFSDGPSTSGPFVYDDTLFSNGGLDAFVARYNIAGALQTEWSEGGPGNDESYGITAATSCSQVQICGVFEDSINFGGTDMQLANGKDLFVAAYDNSGFYFWSFKENSGSDEAARCIMANNGRSSFGGDHYGDIYFDTEPITTVSHNGFNDHYVASFLCAAVPGCKPEIDCPSNDTLVGNVTCDLPTPDYTGVSVTDGCSSGISTFIQSPIPASILNVGTNEITLTATDGGGNIDVCVFEIVVLGDMSPIAVECGDSFTNQTTGGAGNFTSNFSCSSTSTPGEDQIYQITVPEGNQFLQIKLDNVVDANDQYAHVYWLADNCPNTLTCTESDSFNIANGSFSNNSNYLTFPATGPNTYFFVIDAMTDSIQNYDIEFTCKSSGIEFDQSGCVVEDADMDGIVASVNGSFVDLTVQPCESVTVCHDLYIENVFDWEWLDSVEFKLGDCYENINLATLTPNAPPNDNGFYDTDGEWTAVYDAGENSISWEFAHDSGNPWGDGNTGLYGCQQYTFCFDADIASTCASAEDLTIGIVIADDGGKGYAPSPQIFEIGNSNDFLLQDDDPTFTYATNVLCDGDPNVLPDNIVTAGGTFTATAGVVFTDGSPSPTGEIDLTASTIGGPYTITYEVGLCPFTHDFILDINAQEDPTFNYSSPDYCQGDTDPIPTISGTTGGTFSGPTEIVFISTSTGQVDLSASTVGGPYYIKYTTPGPNCINIDSVQFTINAEDDPAFNYALSAYCQGDTDPIPTVTGTTGGTFNVLGGLNLISPATGEIDVSASAVGGPYTVEYTTPGPDCPNTANFLISINAEDDPTFSYAVTSICQGDANPIPTVTGTGGGTFSGPAGISFVSTSTGEIDLTNSTAGGPYTITYTTPGPDCPNSSTFDITINAEDDPSFNFATTVFCEADPNQIPTITGTGGGLFSGPVEISFVSTATGEIDVSSSTLGGPYTITYTTPGPNCPNSSDVIVNIYGEDDPTMNYAVTSFCPFDTDPIPTTNTPGGVFNGPTEIVFVDTVTGEIDLDASIAGGPFEIVYTSPGPECPNTDTAYITIIPQDNPSFAYLYPNFCTSNDFEQLTAIQTTGGIFSSDPEISIDPSTGTVDITQSTVGGPYTIKYVTQGTCPDSSEVQITIYEDVTADAGPDQTLVLTDQTNLAATSLNVYDTGTWSFITGGGNITDVNDPTTLVSALEDGTNEFMWMVSNPGCLSKIDTVAITLSEFLIPEAVTPNGDGFNDLFEIIGITNFSSKVEIFNRWGQKVYEAIDYQNNWDGTDEGGNELVNDTYYYIIKIEETTYKGFVVIQR